VYETVQKPLNRRKICWLTFHLQVKENTLMPNDLICLYCKGTGKRFSGVPCDHYDPCTNKCRLLRQGKTAAVFDQGRCEPARMLIAAITKQIEAFWYIIMPKEHQQYGRKPVRKDQA